MRKDYLNATIGRVKFEGIMRKEHIKKTNKCPDSEYGSYSDASEIIIEQLKRNNRLWLLKRLKEYGKKWNKMHHKNRRFQ